tara:strand:+ start:230 stop:1312 length:1083 start_codon:yes stop_codon:yes gene_type:complete
MSEKVKKPNLFTSLFALFIYDLFGEINSWSKVYKQGWLNYIQSFQDKESGYFLEKSLGINTDNANKKPLYQLNTFCLSALGILDAAPIHKLKFSDEYLTVGYLEKYLEKHNCLNGLPGSGNFAMFLGIFITHRLKDYESSDYKLILNNWFKKHDENIKINGLWGDSFSDSTVWGFQNALHQLIIYKYWEKFPPKVNVLVNKILVLQDKQGNYGALPGGSGCFDYDASFILLNFATDQDSSRVYNQLLKLHNSIILSQNKDGGFCETNRYPKNIIQLYKGAKNYSNDYNFISFFYRLREMVRYLKKEKQYHSNHWSQEAYKLEDSDLWNTWFRLLTIAQIEKKYIKNVKWNFHKTIGLGYF